LQGKSMMHFTTMGFPDEGGNAAQRIAWTGWSFFILIVISAYTANLAAFLVRKPSTTIGVSRASPLLFNGSGPQTSDAVSLGACSTSLLPSAITSPPPHSLPSAAVLQTVDGGRHPS
tara:strand:- start:720 stop:1070 length:351 start_codon:yes stop_codon:yes gene_type:complete